MFLTTLITLGKALSKTYKESAEWLGNSSPSAQGNIIQQLKLILYRNYLRIKLTKYVQEASIATYKMLVLIPDGINQTTVPGDTPS